MFVCLWSTVGFVFPFALLGAISDSCCAQQSFLASWFHLFDSAVIIASFVIDIFSRGLTESIGSLIVVLRLWRLAKISEEVVLGATERMEILEQQLEDLEAENSRLRAQLGIESSNHSTNE